MEQILAISLQLRRTTCSILTNSSRHTGLLMLLAQQAALIETLLAGRYVQRGVLVKEVDWLQVDLQDLTWHDWEVFDPRNVVDASLDIDN
jgi:hypothetical protein